MQVHGHNPWNTCITTVEIGPEYKRCVCNNDNAFLMMKRILTPDDEQAEGIKDLGGIFSRNETWPVYSPYRNPLGKFLGENVVVAVITETAPTVTGTWAETNMTRADGDYRPSPARATTMTNSGPGSPPDAWKETTLWGTCNTNEGQ
jgi:hypothetical protein